MACAYPINLCNSLGLGLSDLHHCVGCNKGSWLESVINFPFLPVALSWRPPLFLLGDSDIRHNNIKPLPNMWFANLFFIPWVAFTFIDGFFYYAESFEFWVWCALTSLFLQLLPLLLMTDLFELLVFWKAILYQLFYLLLFSPILTKSHRLAEWIQKQDPYICCLQETHFSPRDIYRLKVRGWKKIFHVNGNLKKAGLAILLSEKNRP